MRDDGAAPPGPAELPLGAILAGGRSRRFGSPKHLAMLGGRPLLDWVTDAVRAAGLEPVLIGADAGAGAAIVPLRGRPDAVGGTGPLGGIHAALLWAEQENRPGALCVACDTPFLPSALLQRLVLRLPGSGAEVVAPASRGPLGLEPLCAIYRSACAAAVSRRIQTGERALGGLLAELRTERIPLDEVGRFGDPDVLFLNVNTAEQLAHAERIAQRIMTP